MKQLKGYQSYAIDELKDYFDLYIKREEKEIVLKAPTGSGKTLILTKFLEDICLDNKYADEKISFIWVSIGKGDLHRQSYSKVKEELNGSPDCELLTPSFLQSHEFIDDKQIIFVNWEKLVQKVSKTNEWKNSMMRDQEGRNFLELLQVTRENQSKIVLIVDESHVGINNEDSRIAQFKNEIIKPTLTIEMSATPKTKPDIEIDLDEVIAEGMVKEQLIINNNIKDENDEEGLNKDTLTLVLEKAEEQRQELVKNFKEVGSNVNPLVLVQIPNTDLGDETMEITENFLRDIGISEENGLLVKWLTGEKNFNTKALVKNNNPIEYLIFKTAVDTGWDCPRAHILVKFREVNSNTAKIQTVGRILRTPEAKKYNNPILDNGYIFTNMEYIDPRDEDYSSNRIKDIKVSVKPEKDKTIPNIRSFYKSRVRSYNSADARISDIVEDVFCEYCGISMNDVFTDDILKEHGFNIENLDLSNIIAETISSIQDFNGGERIGGGDYDRQVKSSIVEIKAKVEDLISSNLNGLARSRSISPLETAFQKTITNHIKGIQRSRSMEFTMLLMVRNEQIFAELIDKSTKKFKELYPDFDMNGEYNPYEIKDEARYNSVTYKEIRCMLSLYDKMYVENQATSDLEERFTRRLDNRFKDKIEWVWHNGSEPNVENFGVEVEPDEPSFRPDFLIKFKNGKFGIFDTKPSNNYNFQDTKRKAEALYKYIHENREQGINLIGGIIVENKYGEFFINQNPIYETYEDNPSAYTNIEFVFI